MKSFCNIETGECYKNKEDIEFIKNPKNVIEVDTCDVCNDLHEAFKHYNLKCYDLACKYGKRDTKRDTYSLARAATEFKNEILPKMQDFKQRDEIDEVLKSCIVDRNLRIFRHPNTDIKCSGPEKEENDYFKKLYSKPANELQKELLELLQKNKEGRKIIEETEQKINEKRIFIQRLSQENQKMGNQLSTLTSSIQELKKLLTNESLTLTKQQEILNSATAAFSKCENLFESRKKIEEKTTNLLNMKGKINQLLSQAKELLLEAKTILSS